MRTLKIIGAVLAVLIVVNLIGRQAERDVADQRDYQKIKTATDEVLNFPWPKQ